MQEQCCVKHNDDNCDKNSNLRPYIFDWHVEYVNPQDAPKKFKPYKTKFGFFMCPLHYNLLLTLNDGEKPILYGSTEEEIKEMLLEEYMSLALEKYYESESHDNEMRCTAHDDNNCYGCCGGKTHTKYFLWRWQDRAKYGGQTGFRILPLNFCERHYGEILAKNDGKQPDCYGWDNWDAIDNLVSVLDNCIPALKITRIDKTTDEMFQEMAQSSVTFNSGLTTMVLDTSYYNYIIEEKNSDGSIKITNIS